MTEPTMETLARRLERVERENRRMKQAGVVALAVIAAVGLMGQASESEVAGVVKAEKFVVQPFDLNATAILDISGLTLYNPTNGKEIAQFSGSGGNPMISLTGKKADATLAILGDNIIQLDLKYGRPQHHAITLWVDDVSAYFSISDEKSGRATLSLYESGGPTLRLSDKKGKERVYLSLDEDKPTLRLYDKKGKLRATLGRAGIETTRTGTIVERPESSLVLFDKAGKVIWSAP